jgi:DNA modification methylase
MEVNKIHNIDCRELIKGMDKKSVDVILTSPFYNSNKKAGKNRTLKNTKVKSGQYDYVRYDVHVDSMTDDEYIDFTVNLFNDFDTILKENGSILYNMSYGAENTETMFRTINGIITRTDFTVADLIIWKKKNALPNSCSPNRLTRIVEYIFVICRKSEMKTFYCNKKVKSLRATGQKAYENIFNFVEAKNNDGSCKLNKATYSTELCEELLKIYAPKDALVFDPFMGTGTTANACVRQGLNYLGSEISPDQCIWANERIEKTKEGIKTQY